jgi:hypothetical protein
MEGTDMAYGMFYKQVEITKKNGRLPSVEDAIKLAEERFWEGDEPNPCQCFHDLDEAREALAKEKCELLPSQYYALGAGYCAYMYCLVEIGSGDGYGFAEWTYPQDDEEG